MILDIHGSYLSNKKPEKVGKVSINSLYFMQNNKDIIMGINRSYPDQVIEPKRPSAKMEIDSDIKLAKQLSSRDIPHDVREAVDFILGDSWVDDQVNRHMTAIANYLPSSDINNHSEEAKRFNMVVAFIYLFDDEKKELFLKNNWITKEQLNAIDKRNDVNLSHAFVFKDSMGSRIANQQVFATDMARSLSKIGESLVTKGDPVGIQGSNQAQPELKHRIKCSYKNHTYAAMVVNQDGVIINYEHLKEGDSLIIMDRGEPIYQGMGLENTSPVFIIANHQVEKVKAFLSGQPTPNTSFEESMAEFENIGLEESEVLKLNGDVHLELQGGKYFKEGICGYANIKAFIRAGLQLKYKDNPKKALEKYKEFATHNRIRTFEEDFLQKGIQISETNQRHMLMKIYRRLVKHKQETEPYGVYNVLNDEYGHHPVTQYMIQVLELYGPSPMALLTAKFIQANREVLFEKQNHEEAIDAVKKFVADKAQAQKEAIKSSNWNEFIESGGVFTKEIAKGKEDKILKNLIESGYSYSRLKDDGIFKITGDLTNIKVDYLSSDALRLMKKYGYITYNQPLELVVKAYLNDRITATEVMDKIGVTLDEMRKSGYKNNAIFAEHLQGISDVSEKSSLAEIYVKLASKPEQQGKFTQQIKDHVSEVEYFIFCVSIAFHKFMEMISPSKNDSIENREETVNTEAREEENILKVKILDLTGDAARQSRSTLHDGGSQVGHGSLTREADSIASNSGDHHHDDPSLDRGSSHEPDGRETSI